jgi:hypothetical protein
MESIIYKELKGKFEPIVMLRSDQKPTGAIQPKQGAFGCIMTYFAQVVVNGKTAVFDRDTCCCPGSVAGLGFVNGYTAIPDGVDIFSAFFSKGLQAAKDPETYQAFSEKMGEHTKTKFIEGERFFSSRERACRWIKEELPIYDFPEKFVILKPLSALTEKEVPQSVIFTVNPLELTVLMTLAGSIRDGINMTVTPQGAACQMIGAYVFHQTKSENPCAVLGLIDLSPRFYIRKLIPDEYLTYTVPWALYLQLEKEAEDGVFHSPLWKDLL